MKTGKGIDIPDDLADALQAEPETRARRIDSVRTRIVEWGRRHQLLPEA